MHILFLSPWFPYPANNGSKLRIYNLLRGLAQAHEVSLISYTDKPVGAAPDELRKICNTVHILPARAYNASSVRAMLGLFSSRPRVLVDRYQADMDACIQGEVYSGKYDLVIASQWYTATYLDGSSPVRQRLFTQQPELASQPALPAIFEEMEVGVFQDNVNQAQGMVRRMRHQLTNLKMMRYFQDLLQRFAAVTVASDPERQLLQRLLPDYAPVVVLPNGVQLADYQAVSERPEPETMIFTGSFRYHANYQAMQWFLSQVYPKVKAAVPDARLMITGDHAGKPLPEAKNVVLTGFVEDVHPLIASSWMSLAPLLTGGGTRLKILESMALRTPVVATSKGAQGLDAVDGEHLLIADTPQEYATAVIRLMQDPGLRQRLVDNAYELVRQQYDWPVLTPRLLSLVEQVTVKV